LRRCDVLQNVSTVVRIALITGISVTGLLTILAVFVGETSPRRGFLPWTTTWGDRFFVSLLVFFFISLIWLKFIEPVISVHGALIIGLIAGVVIVKYG
jgi:predicted small integral membrane protein